MRYMFVFSEMACMMSFLLRVKFLIVTSRLVAVVFLEEVADVVGFWIGSDSRSVHVKIVVICWWDHFFFIVSVGYLLARVLAFPHAVEYVGSRASPVVVVDADPLLTRPVPLSDRHLVATETVSGGRWGGADLRATLVFVHHRVLGYLLFCENIEFFNVQF